MHVDAGGVPVTDAGSIPAASTRSSRKPAAADLRDGGRSSVPGSLRLDHLAAPRQHPRPDELHDDFVLLLAVALDGHGCTELDMDRQVPLQGTEVLEPTQLSIILKTDFDACLARHPEIANHVIKGLINRLRISTENVRSLALMDVYGRVARLLLQVAEEVDGKLVVKEKLTQQDIADRVGSSREMISRILKDLKIGNYIEIHDKQITINESLPSHW